jgi:major intracellular serine protease
MTKTMSLLPFTVKKDLELTTGIPYGIQMMNAPEMWKLGEMGEGTVVCILDTGIDVTHPDLKSQIIDGRNFTSEGGRDDFQDLNGHGTHVAGVIGGKLKDSGMIGVAPKTKLLIGKVLDSKGSGDYRSITRAIKWATKWRGANGERVRVINMSLGGSYHDEEQYEAILQAVSKGILVVVASGNEGDDDEETYEYGYPALYNECITVSACDKERKLAPFSNNHKQVDVISAGVDVFSTYPYSDYAILSGTSMATPHVSGALALIINYGERKFGRTLSESEIFALLVECCCELDYKTTSQGHGTIDLTKLYKKCPE